MTTPYLAKYTEIERDLDRRELSNRAARGRVQHVKEHLVTEKNLLIGLKYDQFRGCIQDYRGTSLIRNSEQQLHQSSKAEELCQVRQLWT